MIAMVMKQVRLATSYLCLIQFIVAWRVSVQKEIPSMLLESSIPWMLPGAIRQKAMSSPEDREERRELRTSVVKWSGDGTLREAAWDRTWEGQSLPSSNTDCSWNDLEPES